MKLRGLKIAGARVSVITTSAWQKLDLNVPYNMTVELDDLIVANTSDFPTFGVVERECFVVVGRTHVEDRFFEVDDCLSNEFVRGRRLVRQINVIRFFGGCHLMSLGTKGSTRKRLHGLVSYVHERQKFLLNCSLSWKKVSCSSNIGKQKIE